MDDEFPLFFRNFDVIVKEYIINVIFFIIALFRGFSPTGPREERDDLVNPYWMEDVKVVRRGEIDYLPVNEVQFWKDLIEKYLFPLNKDAKEQVSTSSLSTRCNLLVAFVVVNLFAF